MQKTLMLSLLILIFSSCNEEEVVKPLTNINTFAFGHSYGNCFENCVNTYLLQEKELFQSTDDSYASCPPFDSYQLLADSSYQKVKNLEAYIPAELWNEKEGVIGMPDAYDQGGYQIQITRDGTSRCWFIDTDKDNIPNYLHEFTESIGNAIQAL